MIDIYQLRYEAHQARKAEVLKQIVAERHSDRQFGKGDIDLEPIKETFAKAPTSCDRQAITFVGTNNRDSKNLLGGLLVGGVGWIHRANTILLLFADKVAYKAGDEVNFMPYLDAGVIVGQIYLTACANNYACCFVNPNIREENKDFFYQRFTSILPEGDYLFCGAIALGARHE